MSNPFIQHTHGNADLLRNHSLPGMNSRLSAPRLRHLLHYVPLLRSLPPSSRFPWRNKSIFRQILLRPSARARPPFVSERARASKRGGMSRVSLVNYLHVLPFLHSPTPPLLLVAMLGREGRHRMTRHHVYVLPPLEAVQFL